MTFKSVHAIIIKIFGEFYRIYLCQWELMSQFVEFFFANCHGQQHFAELIFTSRAQIHKNKLAKINATRINSREN